MIDTIYRLRLDFEYGKRTDAAKLVIELLEEMDRGPTIVLHGAPIEAFVFEGNAACGPYLVVDHGVFNAVTDMEISLKKIIRRHQARLT